MSLHRYLFLDPSSTAVGWALFEADCDDLSTRAAVKAGKLQPRSHLSVRDRITEIQVELHDLLQLHNPGWIALEVPSGRVHLRHKGRGSGLSIYGYAVGRIEEFCRNWSEKYAAFVDAVPETDSTGGFPKDKRRKVALRAYPALRDLKDPGFDISDAIAFGVWWFDVWPKIQQKRERAELEAIRRKGRQPCRRKRSG